MFVHADKNVLVLSIYHKTMKRINFYYLQGTVLQLIAMMILDITLVESISKLDITVTINSSIGKNDSTAFTIE